MAEVDYTKLRLDVLEKLIYSRGIECKMKKDEMIKMLKLDDEGKYSLPMRDTTYEKSENGFVVGVDLKNHTHLVQIGNLILKKEARNLMRFANGMVYYWTKQKLI
jgi:predicted RNA-binding protein with RPS1 domain